MHLRVMQWIAAFLKKNWKALSIGLAAIVLVYLLIHFVFDSETGVDDAIKEAEQKGMSPSYSDLEFQGFADSIHEALRYSYFDNDEQAAIDILIRMQNQLDVLKLIEIYGTRSESAFGFPLAPKTLPVIVRQDLSPADIAEVNQDYAAKAIQYRF